MEPPGLTGRQLGKRLRQTCRHQFRNSIVNLFNQQILWGQHKEHSVIFDARAAIHAVNVIVTFPVFLPAFVEPTFFHDSGYLVRHFNERVLCVERVIVLT